MTKISTRKTVPRPPLDLRQEKRHLWLLTFMLVIGSIVVIYVAGRSHNDPLRLGASLWVLLLSATISVYALWRRRDIERNSTRK